MKVYVSESEDEKASQIQNEKVVCEIWELPVMLKKHQKASGSYNSRSCGGMCSPTSTGVCFSPCGTWLKPSGVQIVSWMEPMVPADSVLTLKIK